MKAVIDTSPFTKFLRTYRKSEVIFKENTLGSEMYIIHAEIGSSRVILTNVMSSTDLSINIPTMCTIGLRSAVPFYTGFS